MDIDLRGEFLIGGTWVDATGKILRRQSLTHTRGRPDLGARVDPSTLRPLINNTDGRFSPDNPTGPYYGAFGRNTPFRISAAAGSTHLATTGTVDRAETPDHSSLDITGDIDIRLEASLSTWLVGSMPVELAGKWGAAGSKSWMLTLWSKHILLYWTTDGTTESTVWSTTDLAVPPSGRMAIRVTLDVNNGSGGRTATFYTASSINGPWQQHGDPVIQSGTTSIFSSSSALDVGAVANAGFPDPVGRFYKFEVRNGIGGSLVANPDFTAQTPGATSFVDSSGRTWSTSGNASLTNRRTRLSHELAAYPTEWRPSGAHAWVDAETRGILRRLRRGNHALDSTLRRRIPSGAPLAYWPLEDGRNATRFYSPVPGVRPARMSGFDLAADDSLAGSNALPAVRSGATFSGLVPAPSGPSTQWHTEFVYFVPGTGPATSRTVLQWSSTGTVRRWQLLLRTNIADINGYDEDGNSVVAQTVDITGDGTFNAWTRWQLYAVQNGGNVDWTVRWVPIGGVGQSVSASFAGTVGRITGVSGPPYSSDLDGLLLGHIAVFSTANTGIYNSADLGFAGETAGARMQRLASEENLPLTVCGVVANQTLVGAQRPDGVLSLLEESADADGGILYEDREQVALRFRDRTSMYNQTPVLVLDYNGPGLAPPLKPTGDDDATQNDVTVTRVGGSSARAVLEEGALSIQAPPNGVGIGYDDSAELNLYSDEQVEPHAYWRLHLGTYEGRRYPQVRVMVHKAPSALVDQILAVDIGDKIVIQNPPIWVAPGDIELIVQGYEEAWPSEFTWDIVFTCTPGAPWTVGVTDDPVLGKADTAGSELLTAVTSSATQLLVATTSGPQWTTDSGEVPFDVLAGGEVMTTTAVSSWALDSFGRTVSGGWGNADTGQAWNVAGGAGASDYSVGSGFGAHLLSSVNVSRRSGLPFAYADADVVVDVTTSATATGNSLYGGPIVRYVDADNLYMLRIEFTTANAILLDLRKRTAAVESSLTTFATALTHVPGTFVRARLQVRGSTLRAKVWTVGRMEPDWQITATDTSVTTSNFVGTRSIAHASNTNVSPSVRYDAFEAINPQTFTVARSANGVTKSQSAGTKLRLAQPMTIAL